MRVLRQLAVPQDTNLVRFPDGQLQNETSTEKGTPVIREIYGDVLTNIYAILDHSGIDPNGLEDSSESSYQILEALKVFHNNLNDLRQIVTVSGTSISVNFDLDNLPENYLFIGQVTEDLISSLSYSITGIGSVSYPASSTENIKSSSIVLFILNSSGSSIIPLNNLDTEEILETSFGEPLPFNNSSVFYYFSENILTNKNPTSFNLQDSINVFFSNSNNVVMDVVLFNGKIICSTKDTTNLSFKLVCFNQSDLNVVESEISIVDTNLVDNQPYMYCDGDYLYFSNTQTEVNDSVNNYEFGRFSFDEINFTTSLVSSFSIDTSFEKTTNVFIKDNKIYTFISGNLYSYNIDGSNRILEDFFNAYNGIVFVFNQSIYYSNGSVSNKWNY